MPFKQLITPNPRIACRPGWCLEYVRKGYGLPVRYGSAIEAWNASTSKHRDQAFPAGVWVPLWFTVKGVPAGHVVHRAPDGSIYSTTDPVGTVAHHHPNLADLLGYYSRAGLPLTYLGWTEDVAGTRVVQNIPKPAPPKPAAVRWIRVESGDTLSAIAVQFGTTVPHLVSMNGIRDANRIFPGQLLKY